MSSKLFLYRIKNTDDRDACVYLDSEPIKFECGHYFSSICLQGSCFSGHSFDNYDDIETILTEEEYELLKETGKEIDELEFRIEIGSERYNKGLELIEKIQPIINKLQSEQAIEFYENIMQNERDILCEQYDLSEDDLDEIFHDLRPDYRDRRIIAIVYDSVLEFGEEEAWQLGVFNNSLNSLRYIVDKCFNYEEFGQLLLQDINGMELDDGRVVILSE